MQIGEDREPREGKRKELNKIVLVSGSFRGVRIIDARANSIWIFKMQMSP